MDQFRQIGEVVGSLKALMVLKHDIQVNQRQCCLLFDMYVLAFETISEEIRHNLRLHERNTKWKALEHPMRELHRIFKEGELYIKHCLDVKDWFGKAISLHLNRDCVEFHIHNLLSCFPVVIEAIETAAEISGLDQEDIQKRRTAIMKKYDGELSDPLFFQWMYGKQYLVSREICSRLESSWKEDRWLILETIRQKRSAASAPETLAKHEQTTLGDLLIKKLDGGTEPLNKTLLPCSILLGANDYNVKRRLGLGGGHVKEIHWLGESFALRNFFGEVEPLLAEINFLFSLSHPNILQYHCGFYDEERKEGYLVMELMHKSLATYIKENFSQRKRVPFSIPTAVDIMLQIARGMEYLHSRKIYHGELNPSNILLKARNFSTESYFHAKIEGFGLTSIKSHYRNTNHNAADSIIWYAPEVLAEQEKPGSKCTSKYTDKADVYSFGMLCFQLLTGKLPFDEGHLQGEKMVRNIIAGERPLFPYPSPKYLANLTRKCWRTNPELRPSFSSLCRILHYIKKVLVINPEHGQPESPPPLVDYCDIETGYTQKFPGEENTSLTPVSQIPFQMYAYRFLEKEKFSGNSKDKNWDPSNDGYSVHRTTSIQSDDEHLAAMDDLFLAPSDRRSVCSEIIVRKDSRLFDQRSVITEVPHRKFFAFDQMSVGSESPGRRFLSVAAAADEKSIFMDSPERKAISALPAEQNSPRISSMSNNQKLKFWDNQEKVMSPIAGKEKPSSSTAATQKVLSPGKLSSSTRVEPELVSPQTPEKKKSSDDQKLISSATLDKKDALDDEKPEAHEKKHSSDDQKICSATPEKNQSSTVNNVKPVQVEYPKRRTLFSRITNHKLSKIPEKKVLSSPEANQSSRSSENSETTASKPSNKKIPVKKSPSNRKSQDTKIISEPEKLTDLSPRSSPARVKRTQSSVMASPTRTPKPSSFPRSSSTTSNRNGFQSPSSSPLHPSARSSRANREYYQSSSAMSTTNTSNGNGFQSPSSSPLNPSFRCARVNREYQPFSVMSPHRQSKAHLSNSEIS